MHLLTGKGLISEFNNITQELGIKLNLLQHKVKKRTHSLHKGILQLLICWLDSALNENS